MSNCLMLNVSMLNHLMYNDLMYNSTSPENRMLYDPIPIGILTQKISKIPQINHTLSHSKPFLQPIGLYISDHYINRLKCFKLCLKWIV